MSLFFAFFDVVLNDLHCIKAMFLCTDRWPELCHAVSAAIISHVIGTDTKLFLPLTSRGSRRQVTTALPGTHTHSQLPAASSGKLLLCSVKYKFIRCC
jgi:hypothetical protein